MNKGENRKGPHDFLYALCKVVAASPSSNPEQSFFFFSPQPSAPPFEGCCSAAASITTSASCACASSKEVLGPSDDRGIAWELGDAGVHLGHGLPILRHPPRGREILVVVHHRREDATDIRAGQNHLVSVEPVLVPRQRRRHAHGSLGVGVDVLVMVVVVAAKVVLHA